MNILSKQAKLFEVVNGIGLFLIAICFLFIHLNSKPAQTQLTYLPMLLPLFFLLPLKKEIYRAELQFLLFVGLIFISSVISYGAQGDILSQDFRSHWMYLLPFGVLAVFAHIKLGRGYLYAVLILSALLVAYNVATEYIHHSWSRGFHTHGKPIFFGNIALTTGLVSFLLSLDKRQKMPVRLLLFVAAVAGVAGSIWSQTRGGWIFLLLFFIAFAVNQALIAQSKKKAVLFGLGTFIVLCLIALPFTQQIETRINHAYSNIENYFSGGNANTSLGLRFEFWRISTKQFIDDPFIGTGRSGFLSKRDEMVSNGEVASAAKGYEHAHSDLFWTLGSKGILGVLGLYGLYLFLLRFYYKNLKDQEVHLYSLAGIVAVTGYMVYGLSESFFSMKLGIGYFIIINLVLIRFISQYRENNEKPMVLCGKG